MIGAAVFTDPAGRPLTYSAPATSSGGGGVAVNASTGAFTYTPTAAQRQAATTGATTDTFDVTASNGVNSATETVTVPVYSGAPRLEGVESIGSPDPATGAVTFDVPFDDPAGRPLTYTASPTSTGGGSVTVTVGSGSYGEFIYTPSQAQRQAVVSGQGTDTFTVTASNGVTSTSATVTAYVDAGTPVAGTPTVGTPDIYSAAVIGAAVFTDPAGRPLTYSAPATSTGGASVSIDPSTGAYTYTPTTAQRQAATPGATFDSFDVTASNGVNSATETVTVVYPGAPVLQEVDNGTPDPNTGASTVDVQFIDPAGRPLTYTASPTSTGGGSVTVTVSSGSYGEFIYTPTPAQLQAVAGTDTVTVTADNGLTSTSESIGVFWY